MKSFWLCFVPLFIAVDAIGVLPIFAGLTEGLPSGKIRRIIFQSTLTALIVGMIFLFVGDAVLRLLGITVADFMIAGGIVLFLISVGDLLTVDKRLRQIDREELGPVPLGVPLIVGPAVLTTIMLLVHEYGYLTTTIATGINIIIAGFAFAISGTLMRLMGKSGAKIISKIASLLLAAIGVMMIRKGFYIFINMGL